MQGLGEAGCPGLLAAPSAGGVVQVTAEPGGFVDPGRDPDASEEGVVEAIEQGPPNAPKARRGVGAGTPRGKTKGRRG